MIINFINTPARAKFVGTAFVSILLGGFSLYWTFMVFFIIYVFDD